MKLSFSQRLASITSIAVIATAAIAKAADTNGTWLYPDPNTTPTFNYLDTLNASWTSDFSTPWLHLYCGVTNGNSSSPVLGELYNKTAPATGSLEFPLNYALEPFNCHFELSRQPAVGLGPPFALSGNFNVAIESNARPVTWSQNTGNSSTASTGTNASKDPQSTTTSPIPSSPSPSPSSSTPTAHPQSSNSGLSQGAKIGIGVGVALGVLALIAVAAAFLFLRRRKRAGGARPATSYASELDAPPPNHHRGPDDGKYSGGRSEMPVEEKVLEKDSAPVGSTQAMGELEAPR